ncbi:hypothetical protein [Paraburkholderia acidiphila]|uniref:Uncharacterized protein n=1 Tax=Paraburkholderia acidiphila TaxID=2571747 RepID=A0A7Z2GDZ4_9BURK|nr:hypothetical protein [Paraburkholderia acidiphila]QGZ59923.1 hypothetical protein FAZ97_33875 [Paraburkholderia acidiphila]
MKSKRFILAAFVLGMASTMAHADVHEVKENIKHDSKEAAAKTGHAAREFGHATANAARTVGHGIAHASREGYEATKRATKRVFHKDSGGESSEKSQA